MTFPIGSDLQEFFKSPCSRGGDSFASGNLEDQDLCDCIIEGRDQPIRIHRTDRTSTIPLKRPNSSPLIPEKDGNLEIALIII